MMQMVRRVSAVVALATVASFAWSLDARALTLAVGFSENSATYEVARLLAAPLADALGEPVEVVPFKGDHGYRGAEHVHGATPDGQTLLVADTLTMLLDEAARTGSSSFVELTPVAKLTVGKSVALVARSDSPLTDWQAVAAAIGAGPVSLGVSGRYTAFGVAWSMMERETGKVFERVAAQGNGEILAAVAESDAELGIVTTNGIPAFNATASPALRPLVTFGAQRSPLFPNVPTFAELTADDENDFTFSFAVFGPPDLPADVVERLDDALAKAMARPETIASAADRGFVLDFQSPDVLRETIARDRGVAERVADYLD